MTRFGDPAFKPAQQGEFDSFCGVYAAVNYLSRRLLLAKDCDKRKDYFVQLLRHLGGRSKLTVSTASSSGFKNGQIQAAFNKIGCELQPKVRARELGNLMRERGARNLYNLLSSLDENEAAMIRVDDCEHWVLVHSAQNDRIMCDDPYPPAKCVILHRSSKRLRDVDMKNGLVFLNA